MPPSISDITLAKKYSAVGAPIEVYRPPTFVPLIGLLVAHLCGAVLYYDVYQPMGGSSSSAVGILSIAALVGFLVGGAVALLSLGLRVLVCEGGVIVAENKSSQVVPWTDTAAVYYSMHGPIPAIGRIVEVEKSDGKRVPIAGCMYRNCFQIAEALIEQVKPRILREAQERLARGESVAFGKRIVVQPDRVQWDGLNVAKGSVQALEWGSIRPTATSGGSFDSAVAITGPDGPKVIATADVPNVPILLDLLESQLGVKATRLTGGFF